MKNKFMFDCYCFGILILAFIWIIFLIINTNIIVYKETKVIKKQKQYVVYQSTRYTITQYHAITKECDATPDIGANGRVAVAGNPTGYSFANNQMKFGTKIIITSVSGDTIWTCRDRLHPRYNKKKIIDLLIPLKQKATTFHNRKIFIVKD